MIPIVLLLDSPEPFKDTLRGCAVDLAGEGIIWASIEMEQGNQPRIYVQQYTGKIIQILLTEGMHIKILANNQDKYSLIRSIPMIQKTILQAQALHKSTGPGI